jgi:Tol biopolymer transport system component
MTDLRELFRADDLDVDDVWPEIRARSQSSGELVPIRRMPSKKARSWRRIAIVAAALAIGAASLALLLPLRHDGSAPATPNGSWVPAQLRGWIAYSSQGQIRVVDPAGQIPSAATRVLFAPTEGAAWPLSWSPDGAALLFVLSEPGDGSDPGDRTSLDVLHDDGSVQQLTQPTSDGTITVGSFAPDGSVLVSTGQPGAGVERVDPGTGQRTSVTAGPSGSVLWPAESRNGTIAFIHIAEDDATSVVTISADGHERTVTPLPSSKDASGLSWSPVDTRIVVGILTDANQPLVFVLNADGSGLHQVIDGTYPSWSPDGTHLALDKQGGLITIMPDGTEPQGVGIRPDGSGISGRVGPWNASTG